MNFADVEIISKSLAPVMTNLVTKAVEREVAPWRLKVAALEERILELETKPAVIGPTGPAGKDGQDGRNGLDGKDGAPGLNGKDGEKGLDGKDGSPGLNGKDGEKGIDGSPGRDGAAGLSITGIPGPQGEKGLDGRDGVPGRDGKDGAQGLNGRDVEPEHVKALILTELASWPRPRDGKDGANGLNGKDGAAGMNGKDGTDGVGIDDAHLSFDEQAGFALVLEGGGKSKQFPLRIPFDAGVFEPGKSYPSGAGVTFDGHYFMAKSATVQSPGEGSTDWRLVVRRGKQGRDGKIGPQGPQGGSGEPGPQGPKGQKGDPVGV